MVARGPPAVWLSITGYGDCGGSGRTGWPSATTPRWRRAAATNPRPLSFCGDAIADPLAGLASTVAVLTALALRASWIVDASMADIAGALTGPVFPVTGLRPAPPHDPGHEPASTPAFGADTEAVLAGLTRLDSGTTPV